MEWFEVYNDLIQVVDSIAGNILPSGAGTDSSRIPASWEEILLPMCLCSPSSIFISFSDY